ncbi:carboxypeptidase regulatory-like domain-containing protein [Tautonia sp. JC769]|uniref:carboxypeptidase regulatory-like domain-containing protein n=1 Tax=Tautonia sp. JC769 TaxID=3232135 RepID=UPI003459BD4B
MTDILDGPWIGQSGTFLANVAVGSGLVTVIGCLAALSCREPVHRVRVIVLTLGSAVILPAMLAIPSLPRWPLTIPLVSTRSDAMEGRPAIGIAPTGGGERVEGRMAVDRARRVAEADSAAMDRPGPAAAAIPTDRPRRDPVEVGSRRDSRRPGAILLIVYGAVTIAHASLWLVAYVRLSSLCRSSRPAPEHVATAFRRIAGAGGTRVRLVESDRVEMPIAFLRGGPVIVLPASMGHDDGPILRSALAHEWSHVRRGDLWAWQLATLASTLFWFLPTCWWLRRELRLGQDVLADAEAMAEAGGAVDYAEFLVSAARDRAARRWPATALGLFERRSQLTRRVVMLVTRTRTPRARCRPIWGAISYAVAVMVVCAIASVRLGASPPAPAPARDESPQAPPTVNPEDADEGEELTYTGVVLDKESKAPLAGATVVVRRSLSRAGENRLIEETTHETDENGEYTFTIPPGQVAEPALYIELDVVHPEYAPRTGFGYSLTMIRKNETLGERPFFEKVELLPGAAVTGIVQGTDGRPISGVKVLSYSRPANADIVSEYGSFADTRTDDEGRFRLVLARSGPGVVWVLPNEKAPQALEIPPERRGDLGTFVLEDGVVLTGRVVDIDGEGIAGAYVEADHEGSPGVPQGVPVANHIRRVAVADADGQFTFGPLPPGPYRVRPTDQGYDPSSTYERGQGPERRPLPAVFVAQRVELEERAEGPPIELRAVPHVEIAFQFVDSEGRPRSGHEPSLFGRFDDGFWYTQAHPVSGQVGRFSILAPHGLEDARADLMTNEHSALRFRVAEDAPLQGGREVTLGTLEGDHRDIQVVRYVAPVLLVKVLGPDGQPVDDARVGASYTGDEGKFPAFIIGDDLTADVTFENQRDGRFRSSQLLPDAEVRAFAVVDGRRVDSEPVRLAEAEEREIVLQIPDEAESRAGP